MVARLDFHTVRCVIMKFGESILHKSSNFRTYAVRKKVLKITGFFFAIM